MNKVFGILAHVDAGKTTLSEQILYRCSVLRAPGRVDHRDAFLDANRIERERGITIYADEAAFTRGDDTWYLLDTPGHADFSAEMARALSALDFGVIVVSAVEGIQAHTETAFRLLRQRRIPVFFFINKTDRAGADAERVLRLLQTRLAPDVLDFSGGLTAALAEELASRDDSLLERYLGGSASESDVMAAALRLVSAGGICPCFRGSALAGEGVDFFLGWLDRLTWTRCDSGAAFGARVYKIRHDPDGTRVTFLKLTSGTLRAKETVGGEKVNELRLYQGPRWTPLAEASAGALCAVTGLSKPRPGDGLGCCPAASAAELVPVLTAAVLPAPGEAAQAVLSRLRLLEDEDPQLGVEWENGQLRLHAMGPVQLEVLAGVYADRFGVPLCFGPYEVAYRETIAASSVGWGHFEPLRHYAEVHLRLDPAPRGSGVRFASECPTDVLAASWQNLIRTHVLEKTHRGVLCGAPLDDVTVTLLFGRAHIKHTEGGDFREATYRAVRCALMRAKSVLLEPLYRFSVDVPAALCGRVCSDIQRMSGCFDAPETDGERARITGTAPVSEMLDYSRELAAFTAGRGLLSLRSGGFDICHNAEEVAARLAYDPERDRDNIADSVFCSHGAGFPVRWEDMPNWIIKV